MANDRPHGGFTLVEVLIVVVIMTALAGVVISLVTSSTTDAKEATLKHNLRVMEAEIQLYRVAHLAVNPRIQNDLLPQLTKATNLAGEIGQAGPEYALGPYCVEIPLNPFDGSNKVSPVAESGKRPTGVVGSLGGWQYDESTGTIWPNNREYYR